MTPKRGYLRGNLRQCQVQLAPAPAAESVPASADLNVANAAEQLHVHPNTVRYRLQQIATRSGHDPRTFQGLVELVCILEITGEKHQQGAGQA